MRWIRFACGTGLVIIAATFLAYASWLLIAADEGDGGRELFGTVSLIIGLLALSPLVSYMVRGRKRDTT